MKLFIAPLCFLLIVMPCFIYSCLPVHPRFSKDLRTDTIMLMAYIDTRQPLTDTYTYMGPYFIQFGKSIFDTRYKKTLSATKGESSYTTKFSVCIDSICANSERLVYQKTKTTAVTPLFLISKDDPVTFVKDQKLQGFIYIGIDPAKYFHVSTIGKKRGYGFFRLSENEIVTVRPINKNTEYGKRPFAVALEVTFNNKVICSFIQEDGLVRIAMNKGIDDRHRLLLLTLCLSLLST